MAFWSGEKLKIELPKLIEGYSESSIDCASYRLRVGGEVYNTAPKSNWHKSNKIVPLKEGETFYLPPGQFATILTKETIKVPNNAIAFISIRLSFKLRGLVNVSGFHVDPGYTGKLIFGVYNAGPQSIHIRENECAFLIFYSDLDDESKITYEQKGKEGLSYIPSEVPNNLPSHVESLYSIRSELDVLKSRVTLFTFLATAIVIPTLLFFASYFMDLMSKDTEHGFHENNSSVTTSGSESDSAVTKAIRNDKS